MGEGGRFLRKSEGPACPGRQPASAEAMGSVAAGFPPGRCAVSLRLYGLLSALGRRRGGLGKADGDRRASADFALDVHLTAEAGQVVADDTQPEAAADDGRGLG